MAEIIDPKSVKLLVDGVELPFPVVAAPLSWEDVEVYTPPSEPDPFTFRLGGRGGKSKALADHVATLDPDARIAVAGSQVVTITTAGEYSRSYAATFVPATESETVDGEQVLGELFFGEADEQVVVDDVLGDDAERRGLTEQVDRAIMERLRLADQAGAPIPYSNEGFGPVRDALSEVMANTTQEEIDDLWRRVLTDVRPIAPIVREGPINTHEQERQDVAWTRIVEEHIPPPVRRDWPRRGYEPEQVRSVLQWVTSAGEFSRDALVRAVLAVVFPEHVAEPGEELEGWTYASEWARDEAEGIAARVLQKAKRDRVVAWSHHSRCYYVRPAWQWRRPLSRWWKWPLPHSDNVSV